MLRTRHFALPAAIAAGLFLCGLGAPFAGAVPAPPAGTVGTAILVKKDVRATPPGAAARPVKTSDKIVLQTRIDTGRASSFAMTFPPGGVINVGAESALIFNQREIDAATGRTNSSISVLAGRVRLGISKRQQNIEVGTPHAVAGVKGTVVRFVVHPIAGTFVAVDEGLVGVRSRAGGDEVDVAAGQWVVVPPGGQPTKPARLDKRGLPFEDSPLLDQFDLQRDSPKPPPRQ
ncbi:MAG TPA: FecR domain-containing protein [Thermoanaerobaculia bacterium]|jgi:hypothetical protein|nr:FecR domain-containing protein [Thermoanaerobaculia bacterium]